MIRVRTEIKVAAAERLARLLGCVIVVRAGAAYLKRERRA
jgi:hypothetical protein